jgi:hypothetical protein
MLQNGITGVTVCRKLFYILMKINDGMNPSSVTFGDTSSSEEVN